MTPLDKALEILWQDTQNPKNQSQFYDLFLNSTLYIPTVGEEAEAGESGPDEKENTVPMIIEAEGNDYLMLFDSEERLRNWAQEEVSFVAVPGYAIAAMTPPPLHWAMNVGTDSSKQFIPDEIAWLKEVVERCRNSAAQED